jgi:hypothetical protein
MLTQSKHPIAIAVSWDLRFRKMSGTEVELRSTGQPRAAVPTWLVVEHETIIFSARRTKLAAIDS